MENVTAGRNLMKVKEQHPRTSGNQFFLRTTTILHFCVHLEKAPPTLQTYYPKPRDSMICEPWLVIGHSKYDER